MKLIAPYFDHYAGQVAEQRMFSKALLEAGITYVPWEVKEGNIPEGDAVFWQAVSGYHHRMEAFEALLLQADERRMLSLNSTGIIRWNSEKTYLQELERKGIALIPTYWMEGFDEGKAVAWAEANGYEEIIVKPAVSAGAFLTYRVDIADRGKLDEVAQAYRNAGRGVVMVQPFLKEIAAEGEWSFLFFGGEFSHAVLKTPKQGDYRIQHVHGGSYIQVKPEEDLLDTARKVLSALPEIPAYARVDGIRSKGQFLLMEVELIEPYFYLDAAPEKAEIFAKNMKNKIIS